MMDALLPYCIQMYFQETSEWKEHGGLRGQSAAMKTKEQTDERITQLWGSEINVLSTV